MNPVHLILASTSIYRRVLLQRLRLPFDVIAPQVDEMPLPREQPVHTALRLAELKARSVAHHLTEGLVVGSDQVAALDDKSVGKPGDHIAATRQLKTMRGRSVVFHTALCLLNVASRRVQLENSPTTVHFRNISDAQIEHYLQIEQPYDCAGSAKIEGLGVALVERIESEDPTALIGLPLIALTTMLKREGVEVF